MAPHTVRVASPSSPRPRLIAVNRFHYIDPALKDVYNSRATNKGNRAAANFILVDMGTDYAESNLKAALAWESDRLKRVLRLATVEELINYSTGEWDGSSLVAAFGSFLVMHEHRQVPYIWSDARKRILSSDWTEDKWPRRAKVLCVA